MRRPLRAIGAVCATALVVVVPACLGSAGRVQRAVATPAPSPSGLVTAGVAPAGVPATPTTGIDPRRLPQTTESPSTGSGQWQRAVAGFWHDAVQTGDVAAAMPAFFPLSAYLQVKPAPPAAADYDWHTHLVGHYVADLKALHTWARAARDNGPSARGGPPGIERGLGATWRGVQQAPLLARL